MKARKPRPAETDEQRRKAIQDYIERQTDRAIVRAVVAKARHQATLKPKGK